MVLIIRGVTPTRTSAIEQIARAAGERTKLMEKPRFGDFEYWLAHRCDWITDEELANDTHSHQQKRDLALQTSHRFSERQGASRRFGGGELKHYATNPRLALCGSRVWTPTLVVVTDRNELDGQLYQQFSMAKDTGS